MNHDGLSPVCYRERSRDEPLAKSLRARKLGDGECGGVNINLTYYVINLMFSPSRYHHEDLKSLVHSALTRQNWSSILPKKEKAFCAASFVSSRPGTAAVWVTCGLTDDAPGVLCRTCSHHAVLCDAVSFGSQHQRRLLAIDSCCCIPCRQL